ncbi:MAG: hypothetical protein EPO27_09705 [Betaproteobacteria bacterium]|nr:MAG: hypothetical protein EPO27_09705 [Betaproteobacteria bacterium]
MHHAQALHRIARRLDPRAARDRGRRPQWNFHKYLIDRRGEKVLAFGSRVAPEDGRLVAEIERLLAQK